MNAPLSWFESNPSGRIMTRFAADMQIMDTQFGLMFDGFLQVSQSASQSSIPTHTTHLHIAHLASVQVYTQFRLMLDGFVPFR